MRAAPTEPDQLSVGTPMRALRRARNLTLQDVSAASGLSVGYLSNIERGAAVPSLKALSRVAQALGMPLSHFLRAPPTEGLVTRAGARPVIRMGENAKSYERLHSTFSGATFSAYLITMPPGFVDTRDDFSPIEGEEFVQQIAGSCRCEVGDEVYILHPGDTIHLRSNLAMTVSNPGAVEAQVLWVGNTPQLRELGG